MAAGFAAGGRAAAARRRNDPRNSVYWRDGFLDGSIAPWEVPYTPLEHARVLLIANSAVAWSASETAYYAAARGVPSANILTLNLGAGDVAIWADEAAMRAALLVPIRDALMDLHGQAVILGPGCPRLADFAGVGGGEGVNLSQLAAAALSNWNVPLIMYPSTSSRWLFGTFDTAYRNRSMAYLPWSLWGYQAPAPADMFEWSMPPDGAPGIVWRMARASKYSEFLGHPDNGRVAHGRVGFRTWGGYPPVEDQAAVRTLIDNASAAMLRPSYTARALPVFVHINHTSGVDAVNYAALVLALRRWGLNVKYLNRVQSAPALALCPNEGAQPYTVADVMAGTVAADPHFLRLGVGANEDDFFSAGMRQAWPPLLGGLSFMAPSAFGAYCVSDATAGGVGGAFCSHHPYAGEPHATISAAFCLLQGMNLAEAFYFADADTPGACPSGDPLYAPYGRRG